MYGQIGQYIQGFYYIIIKRPFHLLIINKRNKKYLRDSNFEMHFITMKGVF